MRRDIFKYFNSDIVNVFNAYYLSAEHYYPGRVYAEPFHSITFSLNYSMKYNMNGGALHIHLIRYDQGTAVEFRYSLVQLAGARYAAHEATMTKEAAKYLHETGKVLKNIDPEIFANQQFMVFGTPDGNLAAQNVPAQSAPPVPTMPPVQSMQSAQPVPPVPAAHAEVFQAQPVPTAPAQVSPVQNPQAQPPLAPKFCPQCGFKLHDGAIFCSGCGYKIR